MNGPKLHKNSKTESNISVLTITFFENIFLNIKTEKNIRKRPCIKKKINSLIEYELNFTAWSKLKRIISEKARDKPVLITCSVCTDSTGCGFWAEKMPE